MYVPVDNAALPLDDDAIPTPPLAISGPVEELVKLCVHGLKQRAECLYPVIFIDSPFPGMKNCNWYGCGLLIVALACATLSGCETTGTEASSTASASTAFMSASSSKNAGHLIIQRVPDLGTAEVLNISIDGKQVATLPRGQTYSGSLSPGQHVVSVLAIPNALHLLPTQKRLSVQAGQTYDFTAMWQGNRLVLM